jgi:hypothetical protein
MSKDYSQSVVYVTEGGSKYFADKDGLISTTMVDMMRHAGDDTTVYKFTCESQTTLGRLRNGRQAKPFWQFGMVKRKVTNGTIKAHGRTYELIDGVPEGVDFVWVANAGWRMSRDRPYYRIDAQSYGFMRKVQDEDHS